MLTKAKVLKKLNDQDKTDGQDPKQANKAALKSALYIWNFNSLL